MPHRVTATTLTREQLLRVIGETEAELSCLRSHCDCHCVCEQDLVRDLERYRWLLNGGTTSE